MTTARRKLICLDTTPYYHCITRCVRRAFLCGSDKYTGRNLDHRKGWIEKRMLLLSEVFCVDLVSYAVMSNHYHVIVRVDRDGAAALTDAQVIQRWRKIYKGPPIIQRYMDNDLFNETDTEVFNQTVAGWRQNLTNISRFMGNLNENIARRANREDDCKGTFWESRFKSQAILDLPALLRTMCYVDLNPFRAKVVKAPEKSRHTSLVRRLKHKKSGLLAFKTNSKSKTDIEPTFGERKTERDFLPITQSEYLSLIEWTCKQLSQKEPGQVNSAAPKVINSFGSSPKQWMKSQLPGVTWMQKAVGNADSIARYCAAIGQHWIWQHL